MAAIVMTWFLTRCLYVFESTAVRSSGHPLPTLGSQGSRLSGEAGREPTAADGFQACATAHFASVSFPAHGETLRRISTTEPI